MNKSIIYIFLISIVGFLSSCGVESTLPSTEVSEETLAKITAYGAAQGITFTKSPESIFYKITTSNPAGRAPQFNEYVKVHYVFTKLDGTVLDSTALNRKIPLTLLYSSSSTTLPNYGVSFMKEGESAVFVFPSISTSTTTIEPVAMKITMLSTRNETEQIDEYVKTNFAGLPVKKTVSGLNYLLTKTSASGDTAKTGKTATVAYTGKFLYQYKSSDSNGFPIYTDKFDSGSLSLLIGGGGYVAGFEEAIKLMKVGDKGTFIFPSSLGYGTAGKSTIPGYTPLLFEIEVTAVK
ncbi:FKBP-type peptidyl-prolyl isomerase-like protein [Arcicella aurantiaca]|uniref:Peptidyl-prolyl cis-trans isomerase n=1 Tax=Arcicella aurantiaca TaxID=591202 RepID=A0A316DZ69_9BACT|nr:FKBP-type peptidyl-prolyl cis-trans isomerase [Arcicella aurantiaca]PWK21833.1 FKBP-type peptidyl-prolyl isomerase-like protein [Arcicella aurantiaca]